MTVKLYRGFIVDSAYSETVKVKDGTSIVFLTNAIDKVYRARFYSEKDELFECPVTEILELAP